MNKHIRFIMFIAFLILGIAMSAQFKSILFRNAQKSNLKIETEQMKAMLNDEREAGKKLKASITENEKITNEYRKNAINNTNNETLKLQNQQLNDLKLKAGLVDVKGQGILIKLDDAIARKNYPTWLLIIHDSDIRKVINELKKAGAQAIAINEERLMPTSEQICAGPTILINKNRYPVPYTIKAIGNADTLYKKMDESEGVIRMRRDGIRITVEKSKELLVPKFNHKQDTLIEGLEVTEK